MLPFSKKWTKNKTHLLLKHYRAAQFYQSEKSVSACDQSILWITQNMEKFDSWPNIPEFISYTVIHWQNLMVNQFRANFQSYKISPIDLRCRSSHRSLYGWQVRLKLVYDCPKVLKLYRFKVKLIFFTFPNLMLSGGIKQCKKSRILYTFWFKGSIFCPRKKWRFPLWRYDFSKIISNSVAS